LPLHTRRRVIEAVLNETLGLHNKPKAAVHNLTGPKKKMKKKKEEEEGSFRNFTSSPKIVCGPPYE